LSYPFRDDISSFHLLVASLKCLLTLRCAQDEDHYIMKLTNRPTQLVKLISFISALLIPFRPSHCLLKDLLLFTEEEGLRN
jgi:hypothetical protein